MRDLGHPVLAIPEMGSGSHFVVLSRVERAKL